MHRPAGRRGASPSIPPGSWIAVLPAWGERCARVCSEGTLPALRAALDLLAKPCCAHLYTDSQALVERARSLLGEVQVYSVPAGDRSFGSLSACHRRSMSVASPGQRVLLLTADMVVSRELLLTCEAQCAMGKRAIAVVAMRACEAAGAPLGALGPELLRWAWENRHPMTRECTWPDGRSYDIWRMYFEEGEEVAARVFLPHPLVVQPARVRISFNPTIDVNLLACFSWSETYVVTKPEEGAVVELSPPDKEFLLTTTMRERFDNAGPSCAPLVPVSNKRHREFFKKKVIIRGSGSGECGDWDVVRRVLGD